MADTFLGRWFGKRSAGPTVDEARAELDRLAADRPAFRAPLLWLRELLPDLAETHPAAVPDSLTAGVARAKLAEGVPLLRGESVAVDAGAFRRRWRRACDALEAIQPDGAARALGEAVRRGRLDPAELVAAVVEGRPETVRDRAAALGLDPGLATTVLRTTLFPAFVALNAALVPLHETAGWDRGYCPTCGCRPLLGEFRGLSQSRFLRCGLCAAGWEVPRMWCPACGCRDHEQLTYLHRDGEEARYRAATCNACRGYVKMLTALSALPPVALLVADAATLHLDLAAAERGYAN